MASPAFLVIKIFLGRTPTQITKCDLFFNPTLLSKVFNLGLNIESDFLLVCVKLALNLLPKDFLYPYHAIVYHSRDLKDQDPIKLKENSTLLCSLILLEFQ